MPNRLVDEASPYLRQHADNPVDWYPWGDEAFAAAARRGCPILLSVGYSACHWCHVMAHESFEDAEVAKLMNALFVNVKVDREERPDVDAVYMDAVQALTGRGGWPMTVFMTPDGRPFFGGTYYPKPNFLKLLAAVDDAWRSRRADVEQNVSAILEVIDRTSAIAPRAEVAPIGLFHLAVSQLRERFDPEWGGFGGAPKFPSTMSIELMLRAILDEERPGDVEIVRTTLDAMASGGMYDHVGGGFARYSVDERWLVPHFEKMLYDQALLARTYLHAAVVLQRPEWLQVATETIDYVLRDLRHPDGGLFSAEDADSLDDSGHSHEGWFYVWTPEQLAEALGDDALVAVEWYGIEPGGNFEGRSIPTRMHARGSLARDERIEALRARMFTARALRTRPGLDDKVLTEWNAMFLATLAEAAWMTGRADWLDAARANGEFLLRELRAPDGRWRRAWQADAEPRARHDALAMDLAQLVDGFTRLGEATGEARWIAAARECADDLLARFWDERHGGLFTTAVDGERLVVRQKDILDNATPSANSTAALALLRLAALTGESRYRERAEDILRLLAGVAGSGPTAFAHLLAAVHLHHVGCTEVAVVGDRPDLLAPLADRWLPSVVTAWGEAYESPLWANRRDGFAYVCRDWACEAPVSDAASLVDTLRRAPGGAPQTRS